MARIVTVYLGNYRRCRERDMANIRWRKISEALVRRGHQVDIATNEWPWFLSRRPRELGPNLRKVPLRGLRWHDYDVVKTEFHLGFETLVRHGGDDHPFILSKLGSVVGPEDRPGIFFYGPIRERLYRLQEAIARTSHYVTLLSPAAMELWRECHSPRANLLLVPGAVDAVRPPPGPDPYPDRGQPRCIFSGIVYFKHSQPEANRILIQKLNALGQRLNRAGVRLHLLGHGEVQDLDRSAVTYLGACDYERSWDYLHHAQVGVVVTAGGVMHNNESSKIYHYLRAGLPTVSEAGFPNDHVVRDSGLGTVVPNGDLDALADAVARAATARWDRDAGVRFILNHHTWDARVAVYDDLIRRVLGEPAATTGRQPSA